MSNLNRLAKLEKQANENRRKRKQKPLTDYSHLSDEELNSLYQGELEKMLAEPSPDYSQLTDQELSDLYMVTIQQDNNRAKKLK